MLTATEPNSTAPDAPVTDEQACDLPSGDYPLPPNYSVLIAGIRKFEPAPYTPARVSLEEDVENFGELYACSHGNGLALVFKGDRDFITRWYNWAVNTSVIEMNARLCWFMDDPCGTTAYVCPKTREDIIRGLVTQFTWEIRRDRVVPPLVDRIVDEETGEREIVWPENVIEAMARERANVFFRTYIRFEGDMLRSDASDDVEHAVCGPSIAESNWGGGAAE